MKRGFICRHIFGHILFGLAIVAGFSALVMLLWNWLMPAVFSLAVITFWQALGLLALARILFGSGGKRWMKGGMMRGHHLDNPIREKWMKMTPEERKEFMKNRHRGFHHGFDPDCRRDFFQQDETGKQEQRGESEAK
ncbi:hypothetical protein FACS189451_10830 [Bacteroidia bacterium]|nr:hypothetical protein FACS189451_10830 [Bacteroidia bacterium]